MSNQTPVKTSKHKYARSNLFPIQTENLGRKFYIAQLTSSSKMRWGHGYYTEREETKL